MSHFKGHFFIEISIFYHLNRQRIVLLTGTEQMWLFSNLHFFITTNLNSSHIYWKSIPNEHAFKCGWLKLDSQGIVLLLYFKPVLHFLNMKII